MAIAGFESPSSVWITLLNNHVANCDRLHHNYHDCADLSLLHNRVHLSAHRWNHSWGAELAEATLLRATLAHNLQMLCMTSLHGWQPTCLHTTPHQKGITAKHWQDYVSNNVVASIETFQCCVQVPQCRLSVSLSVCRSLFVSVCLCLSLFVGLSLYLSLSLSLSLLF